MNGSSRLSYYNYTMKYNRLHIYFVVSVILHIIYHLFIGERAKRARHSQVCSIENRGYIYYHILYIIYI